MRLFGNSGISTYRKGVDLYSTMPDLRGAIAVHADKGGNYSSKFSTRDGKRGYMCPKCAIKDSYDCAQTLCSTKLRRGCDPGNNRNLAEGRTRIAYDHMPKSRSDLIAPSKQSNRLAQLSTGGESRPELAPDASGEPLEVEVVDGDEVVDGAELGLGRFVADAIGT
jgi:hypothetical protein